MGKLIWTRERGLKLIEEWGREPHDRVAGRYGMTVAQAEKKVAELRRHLLESKRPSPTMGFQQRFDSVDADAFLARANQVIIDARNRFGRLPEPAFFDQLRATGCRYVISGIRVRDYVFCGEPTIGIESAWCSNHAGILLKPASS